MPPISKGTISAASNPRRRAAFSRQKHGWRTRFGLDLVDTTRAKGPLQAGTRHKPLLIGLLAIADRGYVRLAVFIAAGLDCDRANVNG
jgi:hypothetical protein